MFGSLPARLLALALLVAVAAVDPPNVALASKQGATPPPKPPTLPSGILEQTSGARHGQRYYLYVPSSYDGQAQFRLLVVMHGAGRRAAEYAAQFISVADQQRSIILAPLFPPGERFQQLGIGEGDVRTDLRVLELVDEVGARYRAETAKFDLVGFSGGGQFAHRFMYLHPERVRAVVAAAPGTVALPTDQYHWPRGVAGLDRVANVRFDLERVRQVRAMLIVGQDDVDDGNVKDDDETHRFGRTRLTRARTLHQAWREARIEHEYVEVPGARHALAGPIAEHVRRFLARN